LTASRRLDAWSLLAGLLIGGAVIGYSLVGFAHTSIRPGHYLVTTFDDPTSVLQRQLATGDGQAYAELARDPSLARPQLFDGGDKEAAYRAQRPLFADLAWVVSLGQPGAVGVALILVNLAACGIGAVLLSRIARRHGRKWWLGPLLLFLPGSLAALKGSASEVVALTLLAAGVLIWLQRPRALLIPVVFFAAAGLTRETSLLVPAGLGLALLVEGRLRSDWRRALALAVTPAPWLAWTVVVRLRFGAWAFAAHEGRLGYPFAGLVHAASAWTTADWLAVALLAVACVVGLCQPSPELRGVVAANMVLAVLMGPLVWVGWQEFARVLLPLSAFAFLGPPVGGMAAVNC